MVEIVKQQEVSEHHAIQTFEQTLVRIPFLKLQTIEPQNITGPDIYRHDFIATVRVGDEVWKMVIEYKPQGQRRQVREAVLQLSDYLARMPATNKYGLLLAPFISEQSAQICRESGIG